MSSYTITIAPNDGSGNSTTLVVDMSADDVRITDVHLHAAGGLTGGQMPTVDFGLLLRAVASNATPTPIQSASAADADATLPEGPDPVAAVGGQDAAGDGPTTVGGSTARPAGTTAAAPDPAPTSTTAPPTAPARTSRRAAAAKAGKESTVKRARGATGRAKGAAKVAAPVSSGGRAYRRMPDDFAAVYRRASTAAAIAEHYKVPKHTAQGWIRRAKAANAAAAAS